MINMSKLSHFWHEFVKINSLDKYLHLERCNIFRDKNEFPDFLGKFSLSKKYSAHT